MENTFFLCLHANSTCRSCLPLSSLCPRQGCLGVCGDHLLARLTMTSSQLLSPFIPSDTQHVFYCPTLRPVVLSWKEKEIATYTCKLCPWNVITDTGLAFVSKLFLICVIRHISRKQVKQILFKHLNFFHFISKEFKAWREFLKEGLTFQKFQNFRAGMW